MTAQPPPDSSPTGPPSGPLSDPSSGQSPGPSPEPPTGTPSAGAHEPTQVGTGPGAGGSGEPGGPGGSGGGDSGGSGGGAGGDSGGGRPWWRSSARVTVVTAVLVAAVALVVYLTRPDGGTGTGEVFLEPATSEGRDPFTGSTAGKPAAPTSPTATPTTPTATSGDTGGTTSISGSAPGLYGGSRSKASCDVEKQIGFLRAEPAKARAFAGVEGIEQSRLPSYLRSLTPLQLRADTRVTNHGFKDGKATGYQAVLQAGTAVLVDSRGVPRVRCACGNPLLPPVAVETTPQQTGERWPAYQPSKVVVVRPATTVVNVFVIVDLDTGDWFKRDKGDATGGTDAPTTPPTTKSPSPTSLAPETATPPTSEPPDTATPESPSPPQEEPESPSPPQEEPESPGTPPEEPGTTPEPSPPST